MIPFLTEYVWINFFVAARAPQRCQKGEGSLSKEIEAVHHWRTNIEEELRFGPSRCTACLSSSTPYRGRLRHLGGAPEGIH